MRRMRRGACLLDRWTALQSTDEPREAVPAEVVRARRLLFIIGVSSLSHLFPLAHMLRLSGGFLARYGYDEAFLRLVGASLALLSGAFIAVARIVSARLSAARARSAPEQVELQEKAASRGLSQNHLAAPLAFVISRLPARVDLRATLAGVPEALVTLAGAGLAILLLAWRWPLPVEVELPSRFLFTRGVVVLSRRFRCFWPSAPMRAPPAQGLRRPHRCSGFCALRFVFRGRGFARLLEGYGFGWRASSSRLCGSCSSSSGRARRALSRSSSSPRPSRPAEGRRLEHDRRPLHAGARPADLLPPDARRAEFGIDLSRSWALRFCVGALFRSCCCFSSSPGDSPASRFSAPVSVASMSASAGPSRCCKPGLHIGLPAPLGVVRRVDFGEVHGLSLGRLKAMRGSRVRGGGVEAAAPASADRLWDESHPTETQLSRRQRRRRRSAFQIVDVDVGSIWRVALSDQAALASAYRVRSRRPCCGLSPAGCSPAISRRARCSARSARSARASPTSCGRAAGGAR